MASVIEGIETWVDAMCAAFLTGDDATIAALCAQHVPIYLEHDLIAAASPQDVIQVLRAIRQQYEAEGLRSMRGEVVAFGLPRRGRYKVLIDWHYTMGPGFSPRSASVTYYFSQQRPSQDNPSGICMEMVEYRKEAFPMRTLSAVIPRYFSAPETDLAAGA